MVAVKKRGIEAGTIKISTVSFLISGEQTAINGIVLPQKWGSGAEAMIKNIHTLWLNYTSQNA